MSMDFMDNTAKVVYPALRERTCEGCGYEMIEFRPLPHCPMCGALAGAVWQDGVLVAASAA